MRPPLVLRTLLPFPLRTEGDKTREGEAVQCLYREGNLVKQLRLLNHTVVWVTKTIKDLSTPDGACDVYH